jgi:hypothetical protein
VRQKAVECGGIDEFEVRYDVHAAEAVSRAFLDHEGEHDALLVRLVARSRAHAHVGTTVGKIEAAQEVEVALDAVGVVELSRLLSRS